MRWKCGLGDEEVIIWIMDQKDLKQIGEIVRAEVIKNNFMLIDLMDVKLKKFKE